MFVAPLSEKNVREIQWFQTVHFEAIILDGNTVLR